MKVIILNQDYCFFCLSKKDRFVQTRAGLHKLIYKSL